jgi:ubiquinone/menaquinone biosynthesis C-methylase UbiE
LKDKPRYRRVEQWEIYDRVAGSGEYPDTDKQFLPEERFDWTLLTEIELFRNAVGGYKKVLDIGCGTGHPSLYIAKDVEQIIGIDKSEKMIEIARRRLHKTGATNVVFEVGDAERLRFSDHSFDAVILCGSLATFTDKKKALREIRRVLKENGKVACIEANWLFQSTKERRFRGEGNFILTEENSIKYRYVKRSWRPHKETDYRCIIDNKSLLGKKLLSNRRFLKLGTLKTEMTIKEIEPYCHEVEYDEEEKFDPKTLANLFTENGFRNVTVSGYGTMYDAVKAAGLLQKTGSYMKTLAEAEAEVSKFFNPSKTEMLFLTCTV